MEPKRSSTAKKKPGNKSNNSISTSQKRAQQQQKKNKRQKQKNNPDSKGKQAQAQAQAKPAHNTPAMNSHSNPLTHSPQFTAAVVASSEPLAKEASPPSLVPQDQENDEHLSKLEKLNLNKTILDIKSQQEDEAFANRKEKQRLEDERKKLLMDTIKKKQEMEKKLKLDEEEKKKMLEKQRAEGKKETEEFNMIIAEKMGESFVTGGGTIRGTVKGKFDTAHFKQQGGGTLHKQSSIGTISRGLSNLFNRPSPDTGTLRKYSSSTSLGKKAASNLFKTISVPRVSRTQTSLTNLQEMFLKANAQSGSMGDLKSPPSEPNAPKRPLSQNSRKPSVFGMSASTARQIEESNFNKQLHKKWEEYVTTLEAEHAKQLEIDRLAEIERQAELERQRQAELEKGGDAAVKAASEKDVKKKSVDEGKSGAEEDSSTKEGETSDDVITKEDLIPHITAPDPKAISDGNIIIDALLKKPNPIATKPIASTLSEEIAKSTCRPPAMVNIFHYGALDIDFSFIFGEAEDLKGFIMWTVSEFAVEERDFDDYPVFYTKDSYIVLNSNENQKDSMYNIHIWTGKESPVDRSGSAAMLAVQLATHLGGKVNHYHEYQGDESELFLDYFYDEFNGIKYKSGGAGSDFNQVDQDKDIGPTTLIKIDIPIIGEKSGRVKVRRFGLSGKLVKQHANQDVAWVLENDNRVYIKTGSKASVHTRTLARDVARDFAQFYDKRVKIVQVTDSASDKEFFRYLKDNKTKEDKDKDFPPEEDDDTIVNLYKTVARPNGKLDLDCIAECYPIDYSVLSNDEVFILDCTTDIFIWAPEGVSLKKLTAGKECAKMFYQEYERPSWAQVILCFQNREHPLFKKQFKNWPVKPPVLPTHQPSTIDRSTKKPLRYNYNKLFTGIKEEVIEPILPYNEKDIVDVYAITTPDLEFNKLDAKEKSHFYEMDTYMVIASSRRGLNTLNRKKVKAKPQSTIYWWEGVQADTKGYASFVHGLFPIISMKFQEKGQQAPRLVRIYQRKEPIHFLNLFHNKIIIHKGSRLNEPDISDKIYQVIYYPETVYLQQLDQNTTLLNSFCAYCTISALKENIVVWKGTQNFIDDEELELYASYLDENYHIAVMRQRKAENDRDFWRSLPGLKREVVDVNYLRDKYLRFYFSSDSEFKVEKVSRWHPSDLKDDQCALLETKDKLYFWIGHRATDTLINISNIFVNDYCKYESKPPTIKKIAQYNEPFKFKLHFPAWDRRDVLVDPLEIRKQQLRLLHTLGYRAQIEEEEELLREYMEYASSVPEYEDVEDYESWLMVQKGMIITDPTTPPDHAKNNNKLTKEKKPKKKKFLGLF